MEIKLNCYSKGHLFRGNVTEQEIIDMAIAKYAKDDNDDVEISIDKVIV